ncbi:hypothetical protein QBC36DRAFT_313451 [Triangularia setosa]|uniref:Uncharacterized protein n=1 Tax=Triangularia setosa TaxID=2587417 RepID=A0AAN6W5A9_9PEZI|nr:hypothetical protein QBC36DRAFT_313451 [Podospora setosa]
MPCFHRQPHDEPDFVANLVDLSVSPQDGANQLLVDYMYHLSRMARSVIELIPTGQLHGLSWDLATCIHGSVVDALFAKQQHLRSLRLTTDVECCTPCEQVSIPFRHLTCISWHGPSTVLLGSLQESLDVNQEQLMELEIDLVWPRVTRDDVDSDFDDGSYHCSGIMGFWHIPVSSCLDHNPWFHP